MKHRTMHSRRTSTIIRSPFLAKPGAGHKRRPGQPRRESLQTRLYLYGAVLISLLLYWLLG